MAAGSKFSAGCVAAEGSVQPVAIIGHAGSTQTLNCVAVQSLQSAAEELLQNQKQIAR